MTQRSFKRALRIELLGARLPLSASSWENEPDEQGDFRIVQSEYRWHNEVMPEDVDRSNLITPSDALIILNELNRNGARRFSDGESWENDVDVNHDGGVSPVDALSVINRLNREVYSDSASSSFQSSSESTSTDMEGSELKIGSDSEVDRVNGVATFVSIEGPVSKGSADHNDILAGSNANADDATDDMLEDGNRIESGNSDSRDPSDTDVMNPDGSNEQRENEAEDRSALLNRDIAVSSGDLLQGNGSSGSSEIDFTDESELKAILSGTGTGKSEIEIERNNAEFSVEIRAVPNSAYSVTIGGVSVGEIRTDNRGKGKLKFETDGDDRHNLPFPTPFPAIANGTEIKVGGILSGVFGVSSNHRRDDDRNDEHRNDDD